MKRDMELVRRIALATSELSQGEFLTSLPDVSVDEFFIHSVWMEEAGLVKAIISEYQDGSGVAVVMRLTWSGCEFADAVRSDTLWAKAKEQVLKPSASWSFGVLTDWLKSEISEGFPTLRRALE